MQKNTPRRLPSALHRGNVALVSAEPISYGSVTAEVVHGLGKGGKHPSSVSPRHSQCLLQQFEVDRKQMGKRLREADDPNAPWAPERIAERLRMLRAAVGALEKPPRKINQTAFARQCGLTQGAYTQYENALRAPSTSAAAAMRRRYGITLDWLYLGEEIHMPFDLLDEFAKQRPKRR